MAYDGKALVRARQTIARRKLDNEDEMLRRRTLVSGRVPEALALEREISAIMTEIALSALEPGGDKGSAVTAAREGCGEILSRRAALLKQNGFDENYLDEIYSCSVCRDTGYVSGKVCACLEKAIKSEIVKELSSMLDMGDKSFERFDLSLYEAGTPGESASVQMAMLKLRDNCRDYSEHFGEDSVNLLFRGGTGLGKTFLSACIARVVSEKGFSVVYDTCVSVIDAFETQKFERNTESSAESSSQVRRYLNCDLLILDDLGTEMTTAFTQSALYTLINTRLTGGKKTIISTNLSDDELQRRYSPQIVSRLKGEYMTLQFLGRDIREVKKERGI